jgi:hypothetical protein
MKITVTYDLSNEDDRYDWTCALQGREARGALSDFAEFLRRRIKYEDTSAERYDETEFLSEKFYEILSERGLDPWT